MTTSQKCSEEVVGLVKRIAPDRRGKSRVAEMIAIVRAVTTVMAKAKAPADVMIMDELVEMNQTGQNGTAPVLHGPQKNRPGIRYTR
jgi:hypothetical protein